MDVNWKMILIHIRSTNEDSLWIDYAKHIQSYKVHKRSLLEMTATVVNWNYAVESRNVKEWF